MKRLLSELEDGLEKVGLRPNPAKSASFRISVSKKSRKWYCDPQAFITLAQEEVSLSISSAVTNTLA